MLIAGLLIFGYLRGVRVYEVATEGAKEGFNTAVRIIPFLVAIFVAIGMFRASGAMEIMIKVLSPFTERLGLPAEALGMALMRPLSGSGAFGMMSEIVARDPDSFVAFLVSVMQGSTETTFYVLAVYFGAVGITRTRHALPAALTADAAGIVAAVVVCNLWF
ncbi:nucleoside recognition domain-containing protein [Desulfurivibrio alkaliphilus]|nr:nucleoside recognition domain-containing protein [Desulfurivibrio alkaliphilus]